MAASEHLSEEELLSQLEQAGQDVEVGALYAHYRDPKSCYRVVGLAIIEATQEVAVVYRKEVGSDALKSMTWVRPISSWLEKVSVGDSMVHRFQRVVNQ